MRARHGLTTKNPDVSAPPRWYEWRSGVFVLIYAVGFLGGWAADGLAGRGYVPAYRDLAERGHASPSLAAAAALLCAALAVAIRLWGSSYLTEARVWSKDARVDSLVVDGPFCFCRHPLYAANILLSLALGSLAPLWGWIFIVAAHIVFSKVLIAREERSLTARYPEYAKYRRQVGALVPRLVRPYKPQGGMHASLNRGLRTESFSIFIIAGASSFFISNYGWWILGAAYVVGVVVQRRIERYESAEKTL